MGGARMEEGQADASSLQPCRDGPPGGGKREAEERVGDSWRQDILAEPDDDGRDGQEATGTEVEEREHTVEPGKHGGGGW